MLKTWLRDFKYLLVGVVVSVVFTSSVVIVSGSRDLGTLSSFNLVLMVSGNLAIFIVSHLLALRQLNKQSLSQADKQLKRFQQAVESATNHIIFTNLDGRIEYVNAWAEKMTGYSKKEMIGQTPRLWGGLMPREFYQKLWYTIKTKQQPFKGEITNQRKNGQKYEIIATISPIFDENRHLDGFVGVEEDISRLKELDRLKSEFVSIASHELRTPMTAIKGYVSMILDGDYGRIPQKLSEPLKDVFDSTERLIKLVNDLLNLSRIEGNRIRIELAELNPCEVVAAIGTALMPVIEAKKIKFVLKPCSKTNVQADKQVLEQLLNNLIGNALKFTDQGSIEIFSQQNGEFLTIYVKDTGIGIAPIDQKKIFDKFEQIVSQQKGRPQGTGLGLYISRMAVRKLGGELWLESSELGKGSVFAFKLPLAGSKQAEQVKASLLQEQVTNTDLKILAG